MFLLIVVHAESMLRIRSSRMASKYLFSFRAGPKSFSSDAIISFNEAYIAQNHFKLYCGTSYNLLANSKIIDTENRNTISITSNCSLKNPADIESFYNYFADLESCFCPRQSSIVSHL